MTNETIFFDLDFEGPYVSPGIPTANYRGFPMLWDEEPISGDYVFTGGIYHEGDNDRKFNLDNASWEVEAARDQDGNPLYHSFQVVNETIGGREGSFGRFELNEDDPIADSSRKRVELSLGMRNAEANNSDTWYGFSIYIPENWEEDQVFDEESSKWESSNEVIAQWMHPFGEDDFGNKDIWLGPPLTLNIEGDSLVLISSSALVHKHDFVNPTTSFGTYSELLDRNNFTSSSPELKDYLPSQDDKVHLKNLEEIEGKWTDFVFHINWEDTDNNGLIQVWANGEEVTKIEGPNTYHDSRGVYFKSGIYKPDWADNPDKSVTQTRLLYSDNFRIISDGLQVEGYESEFDFVAPWNRPEIAASYSTNNPPENNSTANPTSGSGDYLLSIRGGVSGKALVASHLFEENGSGSANGFAAQPSFNSEFFYYWPEQNWLAGDFNGDGLDDVLNIYNNDPSRFESHEIATVFTHLSDGNGFTEENAGTYTSIMGLIHLSLTLPITTSLMATMA